MNDFSSLDTIRYTDINQLSATVQGVNNLSSDEYKMRQEVMKLSRTHRFAINLCYSLLNFSTGYLKGKYIVAPDTLDELKENYRVPTPKEFLKAHGGLPWDYIEYMVYVLVRKYRYNPGVLYPLFFSTKEGYHHSSLAIYLGDKSLFRFLYLEPVYNVSSGGGCWFCKTVENFVTAVLCNIQREADGKGLHFHIREYDRLSISPYYGVDYDTILHYFLSKKIVVNSYFETEAEYKARIEKQKQEKEQFDLKNLTPKPFNLSF